MLSKGKGISTSGIKSLISAMATNQAEQWESVLPKDGQGETVKGDDLRVETNE